MTAKRWAADQKLEIVLAGLRNEGSGAQLCRRYGMGHKVVQRLHQLWDVPAL